MTVRGSSDVGRRAAVPQRRDGAGRADIGRPAGDLPLLKTGRYLVICMNRTHFLNDWMFGFVDVVGGHDE